mgnify:CR=1 FL=1
MTLSAGKLKQVSYEARAALSSEIIKKIDRTLIDAAKAGKLFAYINQSLSNNANTAVKDSVIEYYKNLGYDVSVQAPNTHTNAWLDIRWSS